MIIVIISPWTGVTPSAGEIMIMMMMVMMMMKMMPALSVSRLRRLPRQEHLLQVGALWTTRRVHLLQVWDLAKKRRHLLQVYLLQVDASEQARSHLLQVYLFPSSACSWPDNTAHNYNHIIIKNHHGGHHHHLTQVAHLEQVFC